MSLNRFIPYLTNKYGRRCFYCDEDLRGYKVTIDHLIPKKRGGKTHPDNLRVCCMRCNTVKASHGKKGFLIEVEKLIKKQINGEDFPGYLEYLVRLKNNLK